MLVTKTNYTAFRYIHAESQIAVSVHTGRLSTRTSGPRGKFPLDFPPRSKTDSRSVRTYSCRTEGESSESGQITDVIKLHQNATIPRMANFDVIVKQLEAERDRIDRCQSSPGLGQTSSGSQLSIAALFFQAIGWVRYRVGILLFRFAGP
jgi:hypothetical protein